MKPFTARRSVEKTPTAEQLKRESIETDIVKEICRQDEIWGKFENRRPSVRLGFACLRDELAEAFDAYNDDRHDDFCGLGFSATQKELTQLVAVAIRLLEAFPR